MPGPISFICSIAAPSCIAVVAMTIPVPTTIVPGSPAFGTSDGRTIWAVVHNEFQGQLRKQLCPTGQYMDCWFNALALTVSHDEGPKFPSARLDNSLVATLPYRYDEVGLGHHGYFNPSNIVSSNGGLYMFAFVTKANIQQGGNCLLRTDLIEQAGSWRGWGWNELRPQFCQPVCRTGSA